MKEQLIDIDALQLDDETIRLLCMARWYGFLRQNKTLNSLADGGAQLIRSFGRGRVTRVYPNGLHFQITQEDKEEMDRILSSEELRSKPDY